MAPGLMSPYVSHVDVLVLRSLAVQGKSIVRWRRKARDLGSNTTQDRPAAGHVRTAHEGVIVKANLARFTTAIVLLASMAMSLGAGIRWWDW